MEAKVKVLPLADELWQIWLRSNYSSLHAGDGTMFGGSVLEMMSVVFHAEKTVSHIQIQNRNSSSVHPSTKKKLHHLNLHPTMSQWNPLIPLPDFIQDKM